MKRFQRMSINFVFICIAIGALTPVSYAEPPSARCILLKAQVSNKDDAEALINMGLDIWEFRKDGVIIRVTDNERRQVQESGFTIETITEDVYEYLETISKGQISIFADTAPAKYHSHDEVIAELQALEASGVAQTYIIGNTNEGRDIWGVKISDNPSVDEDEPGAIFLGCHHPREWISVEVPLYIAQYLADNYDTDEYVKHLVDNCEIWIVPVVDPDGYEYSRTVDRMWYKNRRDNGDGTFGVNISCNYTHKWGHQTPRLSTSSIHYRGPSAFSEPETRAIRDLVLVYDFRVFMSYHSWGQETIYPWLFTRDPCPDDIPMGAITYKMRQIIKETSGAIYMHWLDRPGSEVSSGGMESDWCYGELGVYSFVIELRPVTLSQGGFRLPENQIIPTCAENLPAALYLISLSADEGGIENPATGKTYGSIQFAINDANDGDEIVVDPGLYQENILSKGKNLTLRSTDPNDPAVVASTVIDGAPEGPVITVSGSSDDLCVLAGLTITGGTAGISCCAASPTIRNCTIDSNGRSAIEFCEGYEPRLIDCTIVGDVHDSHLLAHWALDETEGGIAYDSAGDDDGTLNGSPLWQPSGGQVNGALAFDGIDDFVSTPFVLNPAAGEFSVFAWIKGGAPGQVIISQADRTIFGTTITPGSAWLRTDPAEGKLMTGLQYPSRAGCPLVSQTVITDGNWHRVGLTWDSSNRILYVDDLEVARDTQPQFGSSHEGLYIGAGNNLEPGSFFSGLIDDIRIYDRAVTP